MGTSVVQVLAFESVGVLFITSHVFVVVVVVVVVVVCFLFCCLLFLSGFILILFYVIIVLTDMKQNQKTKKARNKESKTARKQIK